jgi:hypothetical protein
MMMMMMMMMMMVMMVVVLVMMMMMMMIMMTITMIMIVWNLGSRVSIYTRAFALQMLASTATATPGAAPIPDNP